MSDKDVLSQLAAELDSIKGLGRTQVSQEVRVGDIVFQIQPVSSERECEAYDYAEDFLEVSETPNFIDASGNQSFRAQIGAAYVTRIKQRIVADSIVAVNGTYVDRDLVVDDGEGSSRPVLDYVRALVRGWESHVLDYFFIEYNKMVKKVSETLEFELPHQVFLEAFDSLTRRYLELKAQMEEASKLPTDDADETEVDPEADEAPELEPEDQPEPTTQVETILEQ